MKNGIGAYAMNNSPMKRLHDNIAQRILGADKAIDAVLVCLLSGGHILIEDVPGVGKTSLIRALADSLALSVSRIQFTPDTLPSDITGLNLYDMPSGTFRFIPGPIMHQILLADEINRTSPRTQAALLEAMEEHCVTVDGETLPLPEPFMVAATQNPVESIGTYALPEAQMDRFLMKISLGYPSPAVSREMARRFLDGSLHEETRPVLTESEILEARQDVLKVSVHEDLIDYTASLVEFTRRSGDVLCGASPRAFLDLLQASRALAFLDGRDFCTPEDIRKNAKPVLAHRLIMSPEAMMRSINGEKIIDRALLEVSMPE